MSAHQIKVHIIFISILCSAAFALEAWTLTEVVNLKTDMAAMKAQLHFISEQNQNL